MQRGLQFWVGWLRKWYLSKDQLGTSLVAGKQLCRQGELQIQRPKRECAQRMNVSRAGEVVEKILSFMLRIDFSFQFRIRSYNWVCIRTFLIAVI